MSNTLFFLDLLMVVIRLTSSPAGLGAQCSQGDCLTSLHSILSFTETFTVRQQYSTVFLSQPFKVLYLSYL